MCSGRRDEGIPPQPPNLVLMILLMSIKRLLMLSVVALGLFFLIQPPGDAARVVRATGESAGDMLGTAAEALSQFIKSLV